MTRFNIFEDRPTEEQEENLFKWCLALENGNYKQGIELLRGADDSYCCLGVMCDLFDKEAWFKKDDGWYYSNEETFGFPPNKILEQYGISARGAENLSIMNDCGMPFTGISKIVRRELGEIKIQDITDGGLA